jgi:hypothetical protein
MEASISVTANSRGVGAIAVSPLGTTPVNDEGVLLAKMDTRTASTVNDAPADATAPARQEQDKRHTDAEKNG